MVARWRRGPRRPWHKPLTAGYTVLVNWFLGVELPPATQVGPALRLLHPQSIVINPDSRIGRNCTIRASTVLGNIVKPDGTITGSPTLARRGRARSRRDRHRAGRDRRRCPDRRGGGRLQRRTRRRRWRWATRRASSASARSPHREAHVLRRCDRRGDGRLPGTVRLRQLPCGAGR